MTTDSTPASPKSRRKAETPAERLKKLERDLVLARQAVREHQQRTFAAIGAAAVAEAKERPDYMAALRDVVQRRVTAKGAKADIIVLLDE